MRRIPCVLGHYNQNTVNIFLWPWFPVIAIQKTDHKLLWAEHIVEFSFSFLSSIHSFTMFFIGGGILPKPSIEFLFTLSGACALAPRQIARKWI